MSRRICVVRWKPPGEVVGFEVHAFDPRGAFGPWERTDLSELVFGGLSQYVKRKKLFSADGVDRLYRRRDPAYMRLVADFVERYRDFDAIILFNFCPIHPEILWNELARPVRILGFVDDPFSTYVRGIPFLWAFDGAFYISPSYDEHSLFSERLPEWGCRESMWWPLSVEPDPEPVPSDRFYQPRTLDAVYVGMAYGPKIDRLAYLRRHFGKRFRVYGRWPLFGWYGAARGLLGKPFYMARVPAISGAERRSTYLNAKIGFNMHLSDVPRETGNMRMYEVPAHGMMLVCDKAGRDAHEQIYVPGREAVFYDDLDHAIELIEHYLDRDNERVAIARAGHARYLRDYRWDRNLTRLLRWSMEVKDRRDTNAARDSAGSGKDAAQAGGQVLTGNDV